MEKKTIIKLHLTFWILVLSLSLFNTLVYIGNPLFTTLIISVSLRLICNIFTFYLFYLIVSPGILNKKGISFLIFFELIYLVVFGFIFSFVFYLPIAFIRSASNPFEYTITKGINLVIFDVIAYLAIFSILGSLSKVSLVWYRNQIRRKDIEKQNISNELAMLKAQINPHFLFNTLNNIKALTKSLPSKAIYSVDKLMGIMHYMFYESSFETVSLEDDIKQINNYLDLERIRYSDPEFIDFKITGDISEIPVPPLIFMPFIENAFKHGNKLSPSPGIEISFNVNKTKIHFEIKNFIKENNDLKNSNSGFGLANIRRRLDLLFENKHELIITNGEKSFSVNLNLILQ